MTLNDLSTNSNNQQAISYSNILGRKLYRNNKKVAAKDRGMQR